MCIRDSHWKLGSGVYTLETVRDITGVFETRDAQYRLFIRLTVGMTCITGVLVLLLSKWLTKPIRSLSRAARKMAKGDYCLLYTSGNMFESPGASGGERDRDYDQRRSGTVLCRR